MNTDNSNASQLSSPIKHRKWLWWLLSSPFILIVAYYLYVDHREFTLFINPLPSDEKMIAHFQEHRAEFETLVKNYQAFIPTLEKPVFENLENKTLMKKAAIRWISEKGATWFPNPYSAEAAKQFEAFSKQAGVKALEFVHPYVSIGFSMEEQPLGRSYRAVLLFSGIQWVMKDYMYIPEIPKIEDGRLWDPVTTSGYLKWSHRAFSSLNFYPPGWKIGECVFRQFEPHWLIRMCINY
ncbi:MAG: hypothetical protein PHY54_19560 [Methylococcales bacterium]|nr:hypothetical protein [Methylococcales bacterium]